MFPDFLAPTHLLLIFVVALLVFGPKRLPELGKTLGKGLRDFRGAMNEYSPSQLLADDDDDEDEDEDDDEEEEPVHAPSTAESDVSEPPVTAATAQAPPIGPDKQDETPTPELEPTVDAEAVDEHTVDAAAEHPAG